MRNYEEGMARRAVSMVGDEAPLTEPMIIKCVYLTGLGITIDAGVMRFVGWTHVPDLGGESEERRIEVRFATSREVAAEVGDMIARALRRREH